MQQLLFPGAPNAKGKDQLPLERTFKVCLVTSAMSEAASVPPDSHELGPRFSTTYFAKSACAGLLASVQQQICHAQMPAHVRLTQADQQHFRSSGVRLASHKLMHVQVPNVVGYI